ncbi:MAG: LysM peptidoglycan-binding domain-containing protein [Microthrixaceae bacterium]|nr:LysM peptidoglycan-binding domain-containing protein [Microthrixaceae bacterium]
MGAAHTHRSTWVDAQPQPAASKRAGYTVLPLAVLGSIAVTLGGTAAAAAEPSERRDTVTPGDRNLAAADRSGVAAAAIRQTVQPAPETYTVRPGDTVSGIAAQFGLRTADVLGHNGLSRDSIIHPGQVLRLLAASAAPSTPAPSAPAAVHTVVSGDTISAIAARYGHTIDAVLNANGMTRASIIYPGQPVALPGAVAPAPAPSPQAPAALSHTVVAGDTISAIARRYGTTTDAVLGANRLSRASIIYPGQRIVLPSAPAAPAAPTAQAAPASAPGLDAEQAANAQLIIRVGRELGVSDRGVQIALATAMQESWLRNLDWGDRDSLGLFQQRPSHGWGTAEQVRDPVHATKAFFGGPSDPNGNRTRGLLDYAGWEQLSLTEAAQAVQISAYPDRYARWEAPAAAWLAALG